MKKSLKKSAIVFKKSGERFGSFSLSHGLNPVQSRPISTCRKQDSNATDGETNSHSPNAHKPIGSRRVPLSFKSLPYQEPENKLERPTSKSVSKEGMCTFSKVTCMDGQMSGTDKYTSLPAISSERKL